MEELSQTIWEHIDDLRRSLLRSIIVIGIVFIIVLGFYQSVFKVFTDIRIESEFPKQKLERFQIINQTPSDQMFSLPINSKVISGNQANDTGNYKLGPGEVLVYDQPLESPLLIMGPIEGLILVFKASFWISLVLSSPFLGWIWLQFALPGIRKQERAILIPFLLGSMACLSLGCLVAYFVTLPMANNYLSLFNDSIGQNAWTLSHYVNYVLFLCLGHAVAGEIALLLFILVHYSCLSPEWLISKRRVVIVGIFILSALLTPPDVLTQLFLAFPLMGIYEMAIWYAKMRSISLRE